MKAMCMAMEFLLGKIPNVTRVNSAMARSMDMEFKPTLTVTITRASGVMVNSKSIDFLKKLLLIVSETIFRVGLTGLCKQELKK